MSAVVVMGEAPESEEEEIDEIDCGYVTITGNQFTDDLPNPPETPPSPSPDYPRPKDGSTTTLQHQQSLSSSPSDNQQHQQQQQKQQTKYPNKDESSSSTSNLYDTLLHRKLREKNELLREELVRLSCQPYLNATKEIDSLSQQLIKSQKMVQQVSGTLTKLTKDLKNVEITLDSYRLDSTIIPSFTNKLTDQQSPRRQPDIKNDEISQEKLLLSSSSSTST